MADVTLVLSRIESGDPTAVEQLFSLKENKLSELAAERGVGSPVLNPVFFSPQIS